MTIFLTLQKYLSSDNCGISENALQNKVQYAIILFNGSIAQNNFTFCEIRSCFIKGRI